MTEFPTRNPHVRIESRKIGKRWAAIILCHVCFGLLFFWLAVGFSPSNAAASPGKAPERLIVVGDVHGDFDNFRLILVRLGLVDDSNRWSGGTATLIQTGDVIDRGPKSRQAMDLLIELEKEATAAGGQVVPLLGNHEVMNILGDLRYVSPQDYAAFAGADSEERRRVAYQEYASWSSSHSKWLASVKRPALPATEQEWMTEHPAGFLEYREAFSPEGRYGKWVRQHAAVAKIRRTIFLHGGLSPNLRSSQLEQMNSQVRQEIEEFDKTKQDLVARKVILPFFTIQEIAVAVQGQLVAEHAGEKPLDAEYHNRLVHLLGFNNWLCVRDDGPLWFRGYDQWSEEEGDPQIQEVLAAYDADHIVVAHTVQQPTRIRSRFGGRVFLIDTGMLSSYWKGGRSSALEIRADGKITAQYLDGQEVLFEEKHSASLDKAN